MAIKTKVLIMETTVKRNAVQHQRMAA